MIMGHIETVDNIVTDGLREYDQVISARCGQEVVARPGENRRSRRIGFDVGTQNRGFDRTVSQDYRRGDVE